ncbi:MAG: mannose-1-phosphate guanylyltransferase/mannose-6-phosphate isomerase [Spirochaetota bacterium]|jgi:mannose-1-phosphate guanylyltransferase/mannose-6-phosphate isomerase|nr:mannose-1-phosphate guanylyltransferase/mannose-6-phosphate isomerase [Spirochaetota bacterium]
MKPKIISVIMAGGSGTRLWPRSRTSAPKQFMRLFGEESFIQATARRLAALSGEEQVYVVSDEQHRFTIINQLGAVFSKNFDRLIPEPEGRNTAPAIALSLRYLLDCGAQDDDLLFFSPSDHIIHPESIFQERIFQASPWAKDHIITFGIVPDRAETGYGYIEINAPSAHKPDAPLGVRSFREKPDRATAERFVACTHSGTSTHSGTNKQFLWNSGMFLFSVGSLMSAFARHCPEIAKALGTDYKTIIKFYADLPRLSIDYAIMEKAENILCVPLDITWSDIGSWESVYQAIPHDAAGNAVQGSAACMDSSGCLALAENRLITLLGVRDLAVVDTSDALLVCPRSEAQRVKDLTCRLAAAHPALTETPATTHRPWGSFTILKEGNQYTGKHSANHYKIKHIVVNPKGHLSLQMHEKRSEHWVVIAGTAEVTIGGERQILTTNMSAFVPAGVRHRLANPEDIPLEIIEVQNGSYVGEDDIIRFDDVYGRA